jgi:RHS repeat-associated protein
MKIDSEEAEWTKIPVDWTTFEVDWTASADAEFELGGTRPPNKTTKGLHSLPFGMQMPGRHGNTGDYRYGFQGQETDDEITGSESHVAFTYRVHDARLGRFLSVDPLAPDYPHNSPYAFSENNVIAMIELEGLEATAGDNNSMSTASGSMAAGAALKVTLTLGTKNTSSLHIGGSFSLMGNASVGPTGGQLSLNISGYYANGGVSTPRGETTTLNGGIADIAFSPGLIIGGGSASAISTNYLNGDASTSLMNPIKYSGIYTLNWHYNTGGRTQRTATYGLRVGAFSFAAEEDSEKWIGADTEDRWWTGSGNVNWDFASGSRLTYGFDTYTGNSLNSRGEGTPEDLRDTEVGGTVKWGPAKGKQWYWANQYQNDDQMGLPRGTNQALNNSKSFLQLTTSGGNMFRIARSGPKDFAIQDIIHDLFVMPNFHHFKPSTDYHRYQFSFSPQL